MSNMIERVAKALGEELDDLDVRGLRVAARAAIAAMNEPTIDMIEAGEAVEHNEETRGAVSIIWRVMNQAALWER